jgi:hypothetical protein
MTCVKGALSMKSSWPGFLHKSDLYGWVNYKPGQNLQNVGDSSKKYKMAIFKSKPSKLCIFWPNPYRSDLCKIPGNEYLKLGPLSAKVIFVTLEGGRVKRGSYPGQARAILPVMATLLPGRFKLGSGHL